MKYLIILLLLAGSVWGGIDDVTAGDGLTGGNMVMLPYCPDGMMGCCVLHYGTRQEADSMLLAHQPTEYYLDTVEVCDTVWYHRDEIITTNPPRSKRDSVPDITTRTAVITKQKKQVWLTDDEYDKLMELLKPVVDNTWEPIWFDSVESGWMDAADSTTIWKLIEWDLTDTLLLDSCGGAE